MAQTKERQKQYKHLGVEITHDLNSEIERKAKQKGISKSDLVRDALRDYLNK